MMFRIVLIYGHVLKPAVMMHIACIFVMIGVEARISIPRQDIMVILSAVSETNNSLQLTINSYKRARVCDL